MTAFQVDANVAFDTYDELKLAINDWMDRDDLTGAAPQMIALAEDEIRLELEPLFLDTSVGLTSNSTGLATVPADMKRLKRVLYDNAPVVQRDVNAIDHMTEDTTRPWAYTLEQNAVRLWPAAEHTVLILYQPKLERLTDANPTNLVLDEFPSLYFYGAMVFANGYVADDERAARYRSLFDLMLGKAANYYRQKHQGGQMAARVAFVP